MGAVFLFTLRESLNRRTGLVLVAVGTLVAIIFVWMISFQPQPDGSIMVYIRGKAEADPARVAQSTLPIQIQTTAGLWVILGMFAAAPLLTSHLEKGWADLLFSKGIARWQILLARYAGALGVFVGSLVLLDGIPALHFWIGGGITPWRFFTAIGIVVFSFATLLSLLAVVSVVQPSPAMPIVVGFVQTFISAMLAGRKELLYDVITFKWGQWLIDLMYYVLPKTSELQRLALTYYRNGQISSWQPIWSSALFMVGALGLAYWLLRRKNF